MIKLGEFSIDEVLPFIVRDKTRREYTVGDQKYYIRMNSQRYFTFANSLKCAACNIEGKIFFLESSSGTDQPHFNLYAFEDNVPLLMTKDHIVPVRLGGKDYLKNYQTMCLTCNGIKSGYDLSLEEIKFLRDYYGTVKTEPNSNKLVDLERSKIVKS